MQLGQQMMPCWRPPAGSTRPPVPVVCILFLVSAVFHSEIDGQLVGSPTFCTNEGEEVHVPLVSDDPCITCRCKNQIVECTKQDCPQLEGCHVIEFTKPDSQCCKTCKGCSLNGKSYKSGTTWKDEEKPCKQHSCQAGVVTTSIRRCNSLCAQPSFTEGDDCCPSCGGCEVEDVIYKNGTTFSSTTDACATCICNNGRTQCSKGACPVLSCHPRFVTTPIGECCPRCQEYREVFLPPKGRCLFQSKILDNFEKVHPDPCTKCVCSNGTMLCERFVCPLLSCPPNRVVYNPTQCCAHCETKKKSCKYKKKKYLHGSFWKPDLCTNCTCNNGETRCLLQECANRIQQCPKNTRLKSFPTECCPRCVEDNAVCTVFGDPHYKTFDGHIFTFQGTCTYILAQDCAHNLFSIRVHNNAHQASQFAWTKSVSVLIGGEKVKLLKNLRVKLNRKKINLPFIDHVSEYMVYQTSQSIIFKTTFGVQVMWDGDSYLEVIVPPQFKRQMCGLCGNFNNNENDDFIGSTGQYYTHVDEFAETWKVGKKKICGTSKNNIIESPCKLDQKRQKDADAECRVLMGDQFKECFDLVSVQIYYKSCLTDMCECPPKKMCSCESIKAYSNACKRAGVSIPQLPHKCQEISCPKHSKWTSCANPCPKTCASIQPIRGNFSSTNIEPNNEIIGVLRKSMNLSKKKEKCDAICQPGCQCKKGYVLYLRHCIRIKRCPHIN